jgi:hypothetical protein
VSVGAVVARFSVSAIEPFVFLRRLGGGVLLAATALFVVQLGRRIGWDNLSADNIDVGPYLAGAGGLLALLAPSGHGRLSAVDHDRRSSANKCWRAALDCSVKERPW